MPGAPGPGYDNRQIGMSIAQFLLPVLLLIAGRDANEADVDYFLCAVKILDHSGPLSARFPIENRLIPQVIWMGGGIMSRAVQCLPAACEEVRTGSYHR